MLAWFYFQIIDPCYEYRDSAFPPEINEQLPSVEYQVCVCLSVHMYLVYSYILGQASESSVPLHDPVTS